MKKFLVFLLAVVAAGLFAFSMEDLKVTVFGNYNFAVNVSSTPTTVEATAANYLDFGLDLTYPVAENLDLGLGLGFAWLLNSEASPLISTDGTPSQNALDLFAVLKYSVELDRESKIVIRGFGGASWPMEKIAFDRVGWVFGAGANYTRYFEDFIVGFGAGVEMRIYGKNSVIAVPVGANFEINF
ncbi:hypothetical protein [Thermotoga neapolitana]|uniref:Outer membrane protein beta-barrel domain-containing protein n=1 Tax=Thermotoga neapolitana (strain ATCC 49049 / DSM 4359 / NBRC 107923 / NS-E) TaxID=309803 RepID=B9K790_THENN|nr:hypothetical protein [Thermotoga neapolitana]ACM22823.1 Putative uncharacterized protein precursor [Thermotoga neapolitana DSM 4359]KFZ22077.1 hypothetical protein LA10_03308 [Thermotoga neapolitana LA10]HBF10542.1 hypothetical protein [Thermotoga neapolitana]